MSLLELVGSVLKHNPFLIFSVKTYFVKSSPFLCVFPAAIRLPVSNVPLLFIVAANLTSNKLPEHGASLTADVSGCTCQVMNDCLKITPLLL